MTIEEDSNFLLSGGDSLKALRLCEDILTSVGVTSAELLEVILDGTFADILRHVATAIQMPPLENSLQSSHGPKRRHAGASSLVPAKREHKQSTAAVETWAVKVLRRAGEVTDMNPRTPETNIHDKALEQNNSNRNGGGDILDLILSWSSDTGRCVDASPVLLIQYRTDQNPDKGKTTVFIGSHSHRIQALDLISGSLRWERVLGDRIEASAAVSHCGSLVIIGQYQFCQ